eukprot:Gregarina_sp_Poly_1__7913@NODE_450_length_8314_cov_212_020614_g368_i0_p5_GENE_NODE_450_length_8314_cov_212_020614_g368_i0NODE_450_length_8314_cov_212_020614_g368_i0_p5_ORF_typecomplete_len320_score63_23PNP_UDP_1/PF01048_20/4_3e32_NODE_450_length_8314_cov_212_020614_g368_i026985
MTAANKRPRTSPIEGERHGAVAVVAAMEKELLLLRKRLQNQRTEQILGATFQLGDIDGCPLILLQSGIGKANAALALGLLCERYRPSLIFNLGCAGGLGDDDRPGDIVVATECVYGDVNATVFGYSLGQVPGMPASYICDHSAVNLLKTCFVTGIEGSSIDVGDRSATAINDGAEQSDDTQKVVVDKSEVGISLSEATGNCAETTASETNKNCVETANEDDTMKPRHTRVRFGLMLTTDSFISDAHSRLKLKADFPKGLAVDMEATAMAQVAFRYEIPFVALRALSDTANSDAKELYKDFVDLSVERSTEALFMLLSKL